MQVQYNDNLKEKCLVVLAVTLIHSYALIYFNKYINWNIYKLDNKNNYILPILDTKQDKSKNQNSSTHNINNQNKKLSTKKTQIYSSITNIKPQLTQNLITKQKLPTKQELFSLVQNIYIKDKSKETNQNSFSLNNCPEHLKEHVNKQIEELSTMDFKSKVYQALNESVLRAPEIMLDLNGNIEKNINIKLKMLKDGSLNITNFESTSIEKIDNYIKNILQDADLPNIPNRLNLDHFEFNNIIEVKAKKGYRTYKLRPNSNGQLGKYNL